MCAVRNACDLFHVTDTICFLCTHMDLVGASGKSNNGVFIFFIKGLWWKGITKNRSCYSHLFQCISGFCWVYLKIYLFPPRSKWANAKVLNLFLLKYWSSSPLLRGKPFLLWRASAAVPLGKSLPFLFILLSLGCRKLVLREDQTCPPPIRQTAPARIIYLQQLIQLVVTTS